MMKTKWKRLLALLLVGATVGMSACNDDVKQSSSSKQEESSSPAIEEIHTHTIKGYERVEPTCERAGRKAYWECTDCLKTFSDAEGVNEVPFSQVNIPAKGHSFSAVSAVAPTESADGNIAYWVCEDCDKWYSDEEGKNVVSKEEVVLPKVEHTHALQHVTAVAPKGDEAGNIEYWSCEGCGKYFADAEATANISFSSTRLDAPYSAVDFVVEVAENKEPVVLQLTDPQIIDVAQARPGRGGLDMVNWATDQVEERCYDFITETVNATKPDLIILTGDLVYGEFDDAGTSFVSLVRFMDSFDIPWAPVFGNHDNESKKGVDWQCQQLENAENCLFKQRELTGNGNYSVGIAQGGALKRVFYMLDSNGCAAASAESKANGHTQTSVGFGSDQIAWYTQSIKNLRKISADTKISFAFHVQTAVFGNAFKKYGYPNNLPINIDKRSDKADTDFGFIGRVLKGAWDGSYVIWDGMKSLGADSIFVGHEHCNSASVVYEGVRLQYGQKSSEYDRFNSLNADGSITGAYSKTGKSLIGGTAIPLSKDDGNILSPYIYLCGFDESEEGDEEIGGEVGGEVGGGDEEKVVVGGLQYGGVGTVTAELWTDTSVTAKGVQFGDTTAYEVVAVAQGKLYVNTALLKGKTTFTFSVYIPESSNVKMAGLGEFAIRVKPSEIEPSLDGRVNGYIDFNSSSTVDALKVEFGKWKTYTVDITGLGETCTEFAFNIAKGNTIYLKDIVIS